MIRMFQRMLPNGRLKTVMTRLMVSVVFVPIFLLNILFALLYIGFYNQQIQDEYMLFEKEHYANLTDKLQRYQTILDMIAYDRDISMSLLRIQPDDQSSSFRASRLIDEEIENLIAGDRMEILHNLSVYSLRQNKKTIGRFLNVLNRRENQIWLSGMEGRSKYIYVTKKVGFPILGIVQAIYNTDEISGMTELAGYAKMELRIDNMLLWSNRKREHDLRIELLQDGTLLYEYGFPMENISERDIFFVEDSILSEGFTVRYCFNRASQKKVLLFTMIGFFLFAVALLWILLGIISRFTNELEGRVKQIQKKLKSLETGNFSLDAPIDGTDEFAEIDRSIGVMAERLEHSINENYIMETERKRAELLALQMQINPHFMFNTLETVHSLAKQSGNAEIGLISRKMGEILRYNIASGENYVSLRQEIEQIKSYLMIQKIRYRNRFEAVYDIPEELAECRILKFILQPIVENAIKYAVQDGEDTYLISITAEEKDGNLEICVQDDGKGISEERLAQIQEAFREKHLKNVDSIGLKNVHSRIQITYGEQYGVILKSRENIGTNVRIVCPIIFGEEENSIEHTDC